MESFVCLFFLMVKSFAVSLSQTVQCGGENQKDKKVTRCIDWKNKVVNRQQKKLVLQLAAWLSKSC